ncbi:MAG: hypothetical protein JNJ45_01605 [Chthonomonas sp.]|nr:hypothetical protein [Chthonomonas sp.]
MKMRLSMLWVASSLMAALPSLVGAVQWVGNTKLYLNGIEFPKRSAFVEAYQTLTVVTQTYPIQPSQTVKLVYTTNNWSTTQEQTFNFDFNVGNNSQWWAVMGPFPKGTQIDFYIKADSPGETTKYDNNSFANYGFVSRFASNFRRGPILQWFETEYKTILQRLPEVVRAGYSAIYLPSPVKSGGGGFSVGYNPFDRFDLGDRMQKGSLRTKYGTTQELQELIRTAKRLGIEVYCDIVLNHNDNRASSAINSYPDMIPEDFHINSSANTSNSEIDFNLNPGPFSNAMLNHDLVGLTDIAHEDGNAIATSITPPSYAPLNSFSKPSFVRHPLVPAYYANGVPVAEDVRQFLRRWMEWMTASIGFDGYRLDAVKHMPPQYLGYAADQPVTGRTYNNGDLLPSLFRNSPELYIFGESYTSNSYELREHAKTGMNLLDFPFFFSARTLLNGNGFGNIGASFGNSYGLDASTGLAYEAGGLGFDTGVAFIQSHDDGPPTANNLGYAYLLTRPGRAKVYYDGNNIAPNNWSNFPRPGRGDSLEGDGILAPILDVNKRFARGTIYNRIVQSDLYVFERQVGGQSTLLVGMNDRGDVSSTTTSVQTAFPAGTVLRDYSGQRPDVTVGATGLVSITVPSNSTATVTNNARGYVLYAPITPQAQNDPAIELSLNGSEKSRTPLSLEKVANPAGSFNGISQVFVAYRLRTSDPVTINVQTDGTGDSAFLELNGGVAVNGVTPLSGTTEGLTDGYVPMTKLANGSFRLASVNLSNLEDGMHMIKVRVFKGGTGPKFFSEFQQVVYLERAQLTAAYKVDGDLANYGSANLTQLRVATSNANRLDNAYVRNSVDTLYLGYAGNVDASENLTNGFFAYLDTDPTAGTGIANMAALRDDTGPATRLLSRRPFTAPSGFGAEFGVAMFRQAQLSSAMGTDFIGGPTTPFAFGSTVGLYGLSASSPAQFARYPGTFAFQSRVNKTDPAKGFEIAIKLRDLFPGGISPSQKIGLIAGIGSTGEPGSTLVSTDPLRATVGGRAIAQPWTSNQFLPTQTSIFSDPGTGAVSLTNSLTYTIQRATVISAGSYSVSVLGQNGSNNQVTMTVRLTNTGASALAGPLHLIVRVPGNIDLTNKTGVSFVNPAPFIDLPASLPAGKSVNVTLKFSGANSVSPTFELTRGSGTF